jgi:glycosyltransferase involved in cell wall biosynthesis
LGVPESKLDTVYVGCDESLFSYPPQDSAGHNPNRGHPLIVFYYGAYLPLHGTEVIVRAAHLLRHRPDIRFVIGGDGPHATRVRRVAQDMGLSNVEFSGWIPLEQLPDHIAQASICLGGHFSTVPKATRVISTKTFQFIAMRKATIVGDNPATRELFTHGENAYTVTMGRPESLAQAVGTLADQSELRERIAAGGYALYQDQLTNQHIGRQLAAIVAAVLAETS